MFENLRQLITRLIAAYEQEKEERMRLEGELEKVKNENETCRKQIIELEKRIDNFKLSEAFTRSSDSTSAASKKVDELIKEIDKCIKLIEG